MITPEYLEYKLNTLDVHKELCESILKDIARRLVKNPHALTETASWQAEKAREAGVLYKDMVKYISSATGKLESEICMLFEDAQTEVFNYDEEVIANSGEKPEKIKNVSPKMKKIWTAAMNKTVTEAINLTKTTANTSHAAYIQACDLAHMQVASGAFDYQTAIRHAVKAAARQGTMVTYPSGWRDSLDVAVRRSVLTGVNQTAGELQEMRAEELEHDIMELTAHAGARPEHARWQGRLVSRSGKKGYLSLRDIGYGRPEGFKGVNCRHNWHMFFKGSARAYTDKQLKELENEKVTYNGQPIPVWKAREYQRSLERNIKASKRELIMLDEAGKSAKDEDLKAGLLIDFQNSAMKLKKRESKLKEFCRETGLKYDSYRTQVFSQETENGIKNWGRSVAQKAVSANKAGLTKQRENDIIKEIKSCGIRCEKVNLKPKEIDVNSLDFDDKHINSSRSHNVSKQQAVSYIQNAKFSVTGWKGQREKYYGLEGVAYVDVKNNIIKTAYSKEQFDDVVKKALEVYTKNERR